MPNYLQCYYCCPLCTIEVACFAVILGIPGLYGLKRWFIDPMRATLEGI